MEHTLFANRWYALKPSRLVNNKPKAVSVLGKDLVLWRNKYNNVIVQDDICPHRGARLSMGNTNKENNCIQCPYHGWQFDDSGCLKCIPAEPDNNLLDTLHIDTFSTMESGGLVWFCMGEPSGYNPPVIKEMHNKSWTSVTGEAVFDNDWLTTLENSIDITHVNFVHSDFGDPTNGVVQDIDISDKADDHIRMNSTIHHKSDNVFLKFTEKPDVRVKHDILLPNTVSIQFWVQDLLNVITYVTYTPLDDDKTLMNWVFLRSPRFKLIDWILDYFFVRGMIRAIEEDQRIVNCIKMPNKRISVSPDAVQLRFRNKLKKLKMNEPTIEIYKT